MARTYTVLTYPEKTVYKGFDKRFYPKELKHVLLFLVEGDIDILAIDDPNDYRDALKYLEDMYENDGLVIIGPFSEAPFVAQG